MDASMIIQIISTLGFPIAMCCAMAYYVKYQLDKNHEEITRMNETHRAEMNEITKAVNNNTIALTRLAERLGGGLDE